MVESKTDSGVAAAVQVSILLPTRDRAEQLTLAIESILASSFRDFELLVIVQGHADASESLVKRVTATDSRVRLVRDPEYGSSVARNLGIRVSHGAVLVFTDDDCEVALDWLEQLVAAFPTDPNLGVVCGAVIPAPHDRSAGFIIGYQPKVRERLTGRLAKLNDAGIGANLAFRRRAVEQVGGWDELIGAGGAFEGAGDFDLIYRVLGAGYALLHLPEARVIHHGFRDWSAGSRTIRGRYKGIGAAYTKHVRLGDPIAALLLLQQLGLAGANLVSHVARGKRPLGVGRLWALLSGFRGSFAHEIDPRTRRYVRKVDGRRRNPAPT